MQIAVREAKRRNAAYRQYAVKCFGQVFLALPDMDNAATVTSVMKPLFDELTDAEPMDVDGESSARDASDV